MFLEGFFGESTEGKVHKNRIRSHFLQLFFVSGGGEEGGDRKNGKRRPIIHGTPTVQQARFPHSTVEKTLALRGKPTYFF